MLALGTLAVLTVLSAAAAYGAWRFWQAHTLTRSRLALGAALVSLLAPLSALALVPLQGGAGQVQAGLPAVGAVAAAGFALSRTRRFAPMTLGLWLPTAVDQWRQGETAPLVTLLEAVLGEAGAAHASRTAAVANALAEPLSVPPAEADDLILGALLHAIGGPLATPPAAGCPASVSARAAGATVVRRIRGCRAVGATIAAAGEHWDGSGPLGLSGEALPLAARIVAVAEAFDLASEGGLEAARKALRDGSGSLFDPVVVGELLYLYRDQPVTRAA